MQDVDGAVMLAARPKLLDPKISRIARTANARGFTLPEIAESRALQVRYKYGVHLGNWTDGGTEGLTSELVETLPVAILFMDNIKEYALERQLRVLAEKGCKPKLVFRPYFNPTSGSSSAVIEGYANGIVITMKERYLKVDTNGNPLYPLIYEAYVQGRFILKIFNETNIGSEGFPRGRAGFSAAASAWKQVRAVVLRTYTNAKFVSICNTPGNDDDYFPGDAVGQHYWFHGREAAKANPSAAEIEAAVNSCPMREMFELADYIGTHVYFQNTQQGQGSDAPYYARRFEQSLKFLKRYTDRGKKLIILECDGGYDEGQNKRAELFTWWLSNVIGTNDVVDFVCLWWNVGPGEADPTWTKHETREAGGGFRPIIPAIKLFRQGAVVPDPTPNPNPNPNPTPEPAPSRQVIYHLGPSTPTPTWLKIVEAGSRTTLKPGDKYWFLRRLEVWDDSRQDKHNIYIQEPHTGAVRVMVTNQNGDTWDVMLNQKPANEPAGNFPMYSGNIYSVEVKNVPSDRLEGCRMPSNHHWAYYLFFEERTVPNPEPNPEPSDPTPAIIQAGINSQEININDKAALWKFGFKNGFTAALGDEGTVMVEGVKYVYQYYRNPITKARAVIWTQEGKYNDWDMTISIVTT